VRKVWEVSESGSTFAPFAPEQSIPVREPLSVADAYVGKVLPPGQLMKARARLDKKAELQLARWFALITLACFVVGGVLFDVSRADTFARWLSGAFDRLATAAAVTWVVSYLNYHFYLRDIESKPIVDWQPGFLAGTKFGYHLAVIARQTMRVLGSSSREITSSNSGANPTANPL
jgi:hypothetical protein